MLKKILLTLVAILLVGIAVMKNIPVGEQVDVLTYFDEFKENEYNLVYKDERISLERPIHIIDGTVYVRYEFVRDYISDTVFYDSNERIMTITDAKSLLRLYPDSTQGKLNGEQVGITLPIKEVDEILYIPAALLKEEFDVDIQRAYKEKLFVANNPADDTKVATIKRKTSLRTHARQKSNVLQVLARGEKVYVYSEDEEYSRIRTGEGIIGYIPNKDLKDIIEVAGTPKESVEEWPAHPLGEKVRLVWDQLTVQTAGDWSSSKYTNMTDANVISPTWFEFEDEAGNLVDRGSAEYVKSAHARGLQVWALFSHNFNNPSLTATILSSTSKRQHVIDQLIQKAKVYDLDGINVDIENIQPAISDVWVQFMRELYVQLKVEGLVVTVDVYIPSDWSNHYEREKIAEVCDYFIMMAYDQHWSGSETAGSVSELEWVRDGIERNLIEVPKEKLVLGIPFYTRLWKETANGLEVRAYGMDAALKLVSEWGVTPTLDEVSGQLYAERVVSDGTYKIWLEDKNSIKKRIELANEYDLAGYGGWKLGLEPKDIWEELALLKE